MAKEAREQGAASADLLRRAKDRAVDIAERAVGIALGGVVIGNKAGQLAEERAESEVQSVGIMAEFVTKKFTSSGVDGLVNKMGTDGDSKSIEEMAAKSIAVGKTKGGGELSTVHGEKEEIGSSGLIPSQDPVAGKVPMSKELLTGGKGDAPISTGLRGNGAVETSRRERARRTLGVGGEQEAELASRLRIVTTEGRKEEAMLREWNGASAGAIKVSQKTETPQRSRGDAEGLAAAGDTP